VKTFAELRLRVQLVPGHVTVYHVEGESRRCQKCGHLWKRDKREVGGTCGWTGLVDGQEKPAGRAASGRRAQAGNPPCAGVVDVHWHTVDIAAFNLNGACSCEYFERVLAKDLRRTSSADQGAGLKRCKHIHAARDFDLDVRLRCHETARYAAAGRQREEMF
jgi:hypothetical protein